MIFKSEEERELHDRFAVQAMQSLIREFPNSGIDAIARSAYQVANAMLLERAAQFDGWKEEG